MCNSVYFSTTSEEDLAEIRSEHFSLSLPEAADAAYLSLLAHPQRWFLMSRFGGCSCHYRHSVEDRTFLPPQEWLQEDADDVGATIAVYDLLARMLAEGHRVDVLDVWSATPPEEIETMAVALGDVPRDHFRFFEGVRFELSA